MIDSAKAVEPDFSHDELFAPSSAGKNRLTAALYIVMSVVSAAIFWWKSLDDSTLGGFLYLIPVFSLIFGLVTLLYSSGTTVDVEAGQVHVWQRTAGHTKSQAFQLSAVEEVRVSARNRRGGGSRRMYVVELNGSRLKSPIWMGESPFSAHSYARAEQIGLRLSLPVTTAKS